MGDMFVKITWPLVAGVLISISAFLSTWAIDSGVTSALPYFRIFAFLGLFVYVFFLSSSVGIEIGLAQYCAILFVFWSALSILWSYDQMVSSYYFLNVLTCVLLFIIVQNLSRDRLIWYMIGWSYLFGCSICSYMVLDNSYLYVRTGYGDERATVGELNANFIAYALATSLPVALKLFSVGNKNKLAEAYLISHVILSLAAIVFTGSRGALLGSLLCVAVFFFREIRSNVLASVISILFFAYAFISLMDYLPEHVSNRLNLVFDYIIGSGDDLDMSGRSDIWPIAMDLISNNFMIGIGVGAFPIANPLKLYAHNVPLSIFVETGLFGFLMYHGVFYIIFMEFIKKRMHFLDVMAGWMMFAVWIPIVLTGVWDFPAAGWLVFGWIISFNKNYPHKY